MYWHIVRIAGKKCFAIFLNEEKNFYENFTFKQVNYVLCTFAHKCKGNT